MTERRLELGTAAEELAPEPWWRGTLITIAVLRYAIPLVALPLVPVLLPDRLVLLVLLRPTKEFLLLGGAQFRIVGAPSPWALFAAFVPLMILGVWAFFLVGRTYREALAAGDAPRWLRRALPPRRLAICQRVLDRHGPTIAVLGRIGAVPPTVLAAAAGTSHMRASRYLLADGLGALLSFAIVVGAGVSLGRAWEEGATWMTPAGAVLFVTVLVVLGRWTRAEARAYDVEVAAGRT